MYESLCFYTFLSTIVSSVFKLKKKIFLAILVVWHYSRHSFHFYLFYFTMFVYFCLCIPWLHWLLVATRRPSVVVASGGYSLVSEHRLLLLVASLCEVLRPQSLGSVAVVHRLSRPAARGTFPDCVPRTGPRILNHGSTRDIPGMVFIQWAWFVFLWWVMMLCTLLYAYWQLVFLLLLSMCSTHLPIVEFFAFLLLSYTSLLYSRRKSFARYVW